MIYFTTVTLKATLCHCHFYTVKKLPVVAQLSQRGDEHLLPVIQLELECNKKHLNLTLFDF